MLPVIIANYNRINLLKQTLNSLFNNSVGNIFPIVVDDRSTDGSREYLTQLSSEGKIRLCLMRIQSGPGVCKTYGASIVPNTDYLYFSDNDVYFEKGWDQRLVTLAKKNYQIGILGGTRHPYHGVSSSTKEIDYSDQQVGFSMLISKKVWEKIGPFDIAEFGKYGIEDTKLCNRCRLSGYLVASVKSPVVVHCGLKHADGTDTAGYPEMEQMKVQRSDLIFE